MKEFIHTHRRLLIIAIIILVVVSLVEIGFRFTRERGLSLEIPISTKEQSYEANFKGAGLSVESERNIRLEINKEGFRDDEWNLATGTKKVMVIGDSFVDAFQVDKEERFTELLEKRLSKNDASIDVLNFGKAGAGPEEYLATLKQWFATINPHAVIVVLSNEDDFADVVKPSDEIAKEKINKPSFFDKFYIVKALKDRKEKSKETVSTVTEDTPAEESLITPLYCDTTNEERTIAFKKVETLLTEMKAIAGNKLIVVQIPESNQAQLVKQNCDKLLPEKFIKEVSTKTMIPVVQLYSQFGTSTDMFYPIHLSPKGHETTAKIVSGAVSPILYSGIQIKVQ